MPFASGLLTGKIDETYIRNLDAKDHRKFNAAGAAFDKGETWSGLGEHLTTVALPAVEALKGVYRRALARGELPANATLGGFALRWILDHRGASTVIPGARNVEQVQGNLGAMGLPRLSEAVHAEVSGVYARMVAKTVEAERW